MLLELLLELMTEKNETCSSSKWISTFPGFIDTDAIMHAHVRVIQSTIKNKKKRNHKNIFKLKKNQNKDPPKIF